MKIIFYILNNLVSKTVTQLAMLVDQIIQYFERSKYIVGVFIDLSKAFGTVDYSILPKKLELYGLTDIKNEWVRGYP